MKERERWCEIEKEGLGERWVKTERGREKVGEVGRERDRAKETGADRERERETGRDRERV